VRASESVRASEGVSAADGVRPSAGVRISVRDTGEGISDEDLPFIFDRFWRGDRARSRAGRAGSGLGLAIARQLIRAHGVRISVESELGRGSTFTLDLPADGALDAG
jgi:signal transduction histidine kinase